MMSCFTYPEKITATMMYNQYFLCVQHFTKTKLIFMLSLKWQLGISGNTLWGINQGKLF